MPEHPGKTTDEQTPEPPDNGDDVNINVDGELFDSVPSAPEPLQGPTPSELVNIVVGAAEDIQADFDRLTQSIISRPVGSINVAKATLDGIKGRCVNCVFTWFLPANAFMSNWKSIIEGIGVQNGLTLCEAAWSIWQYYEAALQEIQADMQWSPKVTQAAADIAFTYKQIAADCADKGEPLNNAYSHDQQAIVGTCLDDPINCGPTEPICPPVEIAKKPDCIEICDMDKLLDLIECLCDDKESEGPKIVGWYNCIDKKTKILPAGEKPEGSDWNEAGELQSAVNKVLECFCRLRCDIDEDEECEDNDSDLEKILKGLVGEGIECELPPYYKLDMLTLVKLSEFLTLAVAGATSFAVINALPLPFVDLPQASIGFYVLAGVIIFAIHMALTTGTFKECKDVESKIALVNRIIYTFLERLLPGTFEEQIQATDQHVKLGCPKLIPTLEQANHSFLADSMDFERWQCMVRANGYDDKLMAQVIDGQRSKLNPAENVALFNREFIDEEEYNERIRKLGFLKNSDGPDFLALSEQLPGMSEIIHMMVRDVEDDTIVKKFGLMDDFGKKYKGRLKQWGEWQNVPLELVEKMWAAHWRYPGFNQLTDALHRFRSLPPNHPLHTNVNDVTIALKADDLPEFWVKRLIGTSFHPLGRIDTRRAYRIGAIRENELKQHFEDLGFSDDAVRTQVEFAKLDKKRGWLKHVAVKMYARGELDQNEFHDWLFQEGADDQDVDIAFGRAELLTSANERKVCVAALRKRFLLGEFNSTRAVQELTQLNITTDVSLKLVGKWECQKSARGKQASLTMLCGWLENGTISIVEYKSRLLNLGWDNIDANRIIKVCEDRILLKITNDERKRLADLERDQEKQTRLAEKKLKQAAALEKARKASEDRAKAKRLSNDVVIGNAVRRKTELFGVDDLELYGLFKQLFHAIVQSGASDPNATAKAIEQVSKDFDVQTMEQFRNAVVDLVTPAESFGA